QKISDYRTDAILREDPFGAENFMIPFSLNKKRRWIVPDIVGEEIENDPSISLRVSVAISSLPRNDHDPILNFYRFRWERRRTAADFMPAQEYHDVLRDGRVKHRYHKHAHLGTLEQS
ncbi:hypothetical protein PFISCL1PPCAC_29046, partial [Pristionchus fissidentatus]